MKIRHPNKYLNAKIDVDTAEDEPLKVSRKWGVPNSSCTDSLMHLWFA